MPHRVEMGNYSEKEAILHIFGNTYDDILDATHKLRRWHINPSKKVRTELYLLSQ